MPFQFITPAYAADWVSINADCVSEGVATIRGLECVLSNVIKPIPALIALAAVIMIIMAGIRIINAGSEPKALAAAWLSFTYAIIGLILLAVIWLALVLIKNFTGADVTNINFQ